MATEVKESFSVSDADKAWGVISDVTTLIPCVPGAKVTSAASATKADAEIAVDMGSMSMTFSGPVEIVEQDEGSKKVVVKANAKEPAARATPRAP